MVAISWYIFCGAPTERHRVVRDIVGGVCQCRMYFFSLKNCTRRLCRTGASFLAFHLEWIKTVYLQPLYKRHTSGREKLLEIYPSWSAISEYRPTLSLKKQYPTRPLTEPTLLSTGSFGKSYQTTAVRSSTILAESGPRERDLLLPQGHSKYMRFRAS